MKRQIIEINEDTCIGCGLCVNACNQGAIQIVDGKAKLISDSYCDGLGMCLPKCPVDAIKLIEKDTEEFEKKRKGYAKKESIKNSSCGCPGSANKVLTTKAKSEVKSETVNVESELSQWPVQLKLVSPLADFWDGADLLVAADCCAYAYGNFHQDFIKNKITVIGCPKLDDVGYYTDKLTEIFKNKDVKSITVTRMSVPCCSGIVHAVKTALNNSGKSIKYEETIISPDGIIIE